MLQPPWSLGTVTGEFSPQKKLFYAIVVILFYKWFYLITTSTKWLLKKAILCYSKFHKIKIWSLGMKTNQQTENQVGIQQKVRNKFSRDSTNNCFIPQDTMQRGSNWLSYLPLATVRICLRVTDNQWHLLAEDDERDTDRLEHCYSLYITSCKDTSYGTHGMKTNTQDKCTACFLFIRTRVT